MSFFPRRHKFNAASCACRDGHRHDSRLEARHCEVLSLMARAKGSDIKQIDRQVTIPLEVNGVKICSHRVDFKVTRKDDTWYVVESKGFATPEWNLKHKLFKALFPSNLYEVWTK